MAWDVRSMRTNRAVQMLPVPEYVHIFITVLSRIYRPYSTAPWQWWYVLKGVQSGINSLKNKKQRRDGGATISIAAQASYDVTPPLGPTP